MEFYLAWSTGLTLAVAGLAFGWAWAGPRLPRRLRLAVLWFCAALAVLALAVAARLPHDYRPGDAAEYNLGQGALLTGLLIAVAGGAAALAAVGRRRAQNAGLFAVGLYVAGVGAALYLMLGGQPTVHAPALELVGAAVAAAAGLRLAGVPRWPARALGMAVGVVAMVLAEGLRGQGSRGLGPAAAPAEVRSLAAVGALLLLLGAIFLLRSHGRVLARPLVRAGIALAVTTLVLVLRGPGEWSPQPDADSTTLYGLPLTLLVVAAGLLIVDRPEPAALRRVPYCAHRRARLWPVWPVAVILPAFVGAAAFWHPAPEACATVRYVESSPLASVGAAWSQSPDPLAPRGSPDVAAFDRVCIHRTPGVSQVVYVYEPTCKWAQVDTNYPRVQATGTLEEMDLSNGDSPWLHTTHDLQLDVLLDPESAWMAVAGRANWALLHVEVEAGSFPAPYRPVAGDRVTVAGRWVYDCGHEPQTEIHPAAVVANEHDEWRADMPGGPQKVRVLQVWMNSAAGIVHVPLAPFDIRADFPTAPAGATEQPVVKVAVGEQSAVQWTAEPRRGTAPLAAVHIVPPDPNGSAYFEILLGYSQALPPPEPPISYNVTFDHITVRDDLRRQARNTTGVPLDLAFPQLGFPGSGRWVMQAVVGRTWVSLLDNAPVESGHTYSLEAVPPVRLLMPGSEHLRLSITGYAENDPSGGVQLASGSVNPPAMTTWDAGRLSDLCCGRIQSFAPPHGAWEISYRVTRASP